MWNDEGFLKLMKGIIFILYGVAFFVPRGKSSDDI